MSLTGDRWLIGRIELPEQPAFEFAPTEFPQWPDISLPTLHDLFPATLPNVGAPPANEDR